MIVNSVETPNLVETPISVPAPALVVPTPLAAALDEVETKRAADVIRFRTCCADVRASK